MSSGGVFGSVVARHFGLPDAPALVARPTRESRLGVSRLSCGMDQLGTKTAIPPEDAFVVMLHLADYHHRELWRRQERSLWAPRHLKDSIDIVNLADGPSATVGSPLDALCFYIPRATLDAYTDEMVGTRVSALSCAPAIIDPVLAHLGAVLLPALEAPMQINSLLVDHVSLAVLAHVAAAYGGLHPPVRRPSGLQGWQETRAKDLLLAHTPADISIATVAAACNLSPGYFIKAFKETTGRTPHRWLIERRLDMAKERLRGCLPIADIALACGFADQSHLTRVFTNIVGVPPGVWRRSRNDQRASDESATPQGSTATVFANDVPPEGRRCQDTRASDSGDSSK